MTLVHLTKHTRLLFSGLVILFVWAGAMASSLVLRLIQSEPDHLIPVTFAQQATMPVSEAQVSALIDQALNDLLGPAGLASIVHPGDKVVLKVNTVEPQMGLPSEKGYGIITDPRIVRSVAAKVRAIIGTAPPAELRVVDACFDDNDQPPETYHFYYCLLDLNKDGTPEYRYDGNQDGILDGGSGALLVNSDAIDVTSCFKTTISEPWSGNIPVLLPKFLRTKEQAIAAGEPDEYCDVFINLPVFKNHQLAGMSLSIKNYYGLAGVAAYDSLSWNRNDHAWTGDFFTNRELLDEMLVALNLGRPSDLIIMDALTGNRSGPANGYYSYDYPVDYINPNAIFAATDCVALDTVMTLLAGYQPESVEYLAFGERDGLGVADVRWIHIKGFDAFTIMRDGLKARYPTKYPFPVPYPPPGYWSGDSGVRHHSDYTAPDEVSISSPQRISGTRYAFPFTAEDADSGLARIELIIDGTLVTFRNTILTSPGTIEVDLSEFNDSNPHEAKIAVWDNRLNCTVSDGVTFSLGTAVSHWESF